MSQTQRDAVAAQVARSESDIEALVRLFEYLAAAEGWQPEGELRAHVARSVYIMLHAAEGLGSPLVGGLQLVLPDSNPSSHQTLPCQRVWPELTVQKAAPDRSVNSGLLLVAHVAVLAVTPTWRRTGAYWHLCLALWRYCVEAGIRELWLEATPTMLRCYRLLGLPLVVRGELRTHWGEPCYPCSLSIREVAGAVAEKALRSATYRRLLTQAIQEVPHEPVDGMTGVGDDAGMRFSPLAPP